MSTGGKAPTQNMIQHAPGRVDCCTMSSFAKVRDSDYAVGDKAPAHAAVKGQVNPAFAQLVMEVCEQRLLEQLADVRPRAKEGCIGLHWYGVVCLFALCPDTQLNPCTDQAGSQGNVIGTKCSPSRWDLHAFVLKTQMLFAEGGGPGVQVVQDDPSDFGHAHVRHAE